jgi:hypothetical protein
LVTEPLGVVSPTFTAPAVLAGVTQVTDVELTTDTSVAAVPPKVTELVPLRFVPLMVTEVPPAVVPLTGLRLVIVGAGVGAT